MTRVLPYDRAERVAEEIQQILSIMMLSEVSDPRLSGVRITHVRMTRDLRIARIHYHMDGASDAQKRAAEQGFSSASGLFRRAIGERVNLKFTPEVKFYYDDSVDFREKMDRLLSGEGGGDLDG